MMLAALASLNPLAAQLHALGRESTVVERRLGSGLRVLIGVIGAAALGAGLIVGASELRYAYPEGYAYVASEWAADDVGSSPIIVLERHH